MKHTVTTFIDVDVLMAEAAKANGQAPGSGTVIKLVFGWELETFVPEQPNTSEQPVDPHESENQNDAVATDDGEEATAPRLRGDWHDTIALFPNY